MGASQLNGDGRRRKIVITGCLAQRYGEQLAADMPEADLVVRRGAWRGCGRRAAGCGLGAAGGSCCGQLLRAAAAGWAAGLPLGGRAAGGGLHQQLGWVCGWLLVGSTP
jgi:hypothetical protein